MTGPLPAPDLDDLLGIATELAVAAGELAQQLRDEVDLSGETKSSTTDIVTAADRAAERLVLDGLADRRPHDGVLGEEGADKPSTSGVRWLIDPIDGTTNYVYDIPAWSVSIAAKFDGATVVGVVYDPVAERCYRAVRGGGAWCNDERLACSDKATLDTALIGTGFGYSPERRLGQAEVMTHLLPRVRDIRRFGSAALDLCFAAEGRIDAYFEKGLNPWDLAAGALVAEEAGCVVTDLRDGPPSEVFTLAANPTLAALLGATLREVSADTRP